jgi:hypothetical protein
MFSFDVVNDGTSKKQLFEECHVASNDVKYHIMVFLVGYAK